MSIPGRYEMLNSENFDAYLSAAGVNMLKRAAAAAARPTVEISEEGGVYTIKTLSVFKNTEIKFKPGEEFDETTADGRSAKSTITIEGTKLIHKQKIDPDEAETIREFTDEGMKATFTCKGVTAVRTYKRA